VNAVLYLRLSEERKQALAARAREHGLSLNASACELIARGLQADEEERARERLEQKLAAGASELEATRARLAEADLRLQAASEREQLIASTYAAFAERARGELASCPRCGKPLRGSDLVVSGRCPHCDKDLTSLLLPSRFGSLVTTEYLALLGALGVLAGLALRASAERAG
jgi:plasmid stability protein